MKFMYIALVTPFALLFACGGDNTPAQTPGTGTATEPATFAEQVTAGQKLYGEHCATCHGAGGEGTKDGPRVVGLKEGALPLNPPAGAKARTAKFVTVADVAAFVVKNMPAEKPGTLSESAYFSILAFDLKANGITLDKKLDGPLAATLTIPR